MQQIQNSNSTLNMWCLNSSCVCLLKSAMKLTKNVWNLFKEGNKKRHQNDVKGIVYIVNFEQMLQFFHCKPWTSKCQPKSKLMKSHCQNDFSQCYQEAIIPFINYKCTNLAYYTIKSSILALYFLDDYSWRDPISKERRNVLTLISVNSRGPLGDGKRLSTALMTLPIPI